MSGIKVTRVILADDHEKIRAGIRDLLKNISDIVVVGEASDGLEALNLVEDLHPDVLLLDMEMPVMKGNEVAARLHENADPVYVLALSAYDDRQYILSMLNNGASGYLAKEDVPAELVNALRGVARGEQGWVSPRLAEKFATSRGSEGYNRPEFTVLEQEIFKNLGRKRGSRDIARSLGISEKELEDQIKSLRRKLNVGSQAELILLAIDGLSEDRTGQ